MPAPSAPPPTEIPEEYHVYDLLADRKPAVLAASSSGGAAERYRIFPSTRPSNRSEVQQLARTLDQLLHDAGPRTAQALHAWDLTLSELVRQVFVGCADRGELLGRVRRAYRHYLSAFIERVRLLESTEREALIRRLEAEVSDLKSQLGESKRSAKRSMVLGRFKMAAAHGAGEREARDEAEKKKGKEGTKQEACVSAFKGCNVDEQQAVWREMLSSVTVKARIQCLLSCWKMFTDAKKPDLVRQLTDDMAPAEKSKYLVGISASMPFEERVGVVEALLRQLSSFEMATFVDFLPYVWEDLAVQHANRMLSKMQPADRTRIATQLAAEAAAASRHSTSASDGPESTAPPKVETVAAMKLSLSLDTTQMLPSELPGWSPFGPSSSAGATFEPSTLHAIGAECLEVAAAQYLAHARPTHAASNLADGERRLIDTVLWPRLVFGVLLRRCIPPPRQGRLSIESAREDLWTLITSLRSAAKSEARAKLLARLCGAVRYEYYPQRVACALHVLTSLVSVTSLVGRNAPPYQSLEERVWLPMVRIGDAPQVAGALVQSLNSARGGGGCDELPSLLRSMEAELGGPQKVAALVERLHTASVDDPRPKPLARKVVDADGALLAVLDAFDAARIKGATSLAALYEQLETLRISGALDATTFCNALRSFDPTLGEAAAVDIYVDCDLAAAEHAGLDSAAGGAAASSEPGVLSRSAFIRVCEQHRVRRAND